MNDTYIGVMSGNSMDAADAVSVRIAANDFQVLAAASETIDNALATTLRGLAESPVVAVEQMLTAQNALTEVCARAVAKLPAATAAAAIGCHGQTLAHRPAADGTGATWQLLNGALLAEKTGVAVVCDFRARDIATGGEGAPLAPLFHRHFFARHRPCAIVNIGGIANITHLDDNGGGVRGYDTGPGMMLMDEWHRRHHPHDGNRHDTNGDFAASGTVNAPLLEQLLMHAFIARPPPKSCGREEFALSFLANHVCDNTMRNISDLPPQDAQATFLEFTAKTITDAVRNVNAPRLFVCGGGSQNKALMRRLEALLPTTSVQSSAAAGLPPQQVEAALFAWLAKCHVRGEPLQTTAVTGGKPRIAGAYYPC